MNGEPRSRACTTGFGRMVERAGEAAGLDFKAHPHMLRHSFVANKGHDTRALQAQEHPAHGALYRLGAGPFQGLLALTPRPSASEVLRLLSSSRSGRRRECIGCVSRGSKLWISGIGSSVDPAVGASIAATRSLSHCLSDSRLLPMNSERTSIRKPPRLPNKFHTGCLPVPPDQLARTAPRSSHVKSQFEMGGNCSLSRNDDFGPVRIDG